MKLLMHAGGHYADLHDLQQVPLPQETHTYKPVSHYDLAINLQQVSQDLLRGHELANCLYGLAREGKQMFGVHTYRQAEDDPLGLSIGFRNSYDKSMSVGIAIGGSVFVCDNLSLTGEITIMRRHTPNVWKDLEELIVTTVYRSKNNFLTITEDAQKMRSLVISDDEAFQWMGLLFGRKVITPRQLPVVKDQWLKPAHEPFRERNLWSFYNACTAALESSTPAKIMEKHIELHESLTVELCRETSLAR